MSGISSSEEINVIVNGTKASASLKEMRGAIALMNKELQQLPKNSDAFTNKKAELQKLRGEYKSLQKEISGLPPAMEKSNQGLGLMTKGTGLLKNAFKAAVAALLPLLAFQKIIELGQHFLGVSNEVNKLKGNISTLTGATGKELDGLTTRVLSIGRTFDKDFNEVLKSADVLAKQMGVSHNEAFDLIEKGLLAGGNLSEDFLEQIREYAPQFKDAGASAEQFVAQLVKASKAQIFQDKGADVIKEFGLRIREQTKATSDALQNAFGPKFTKDLFAGIDNGSITTVEALQKVSKQMNRTELSASQLQTIVADVFGGPGEDAGLDYLRSLEDIGGELDLMIDVTNALTRRKMEQLELERELAAAQTELSDEIGFLTSTSNTLWLQLETFGTKALLGIINGFQYLLELFENSGAAIEGLKAGFLAFFQNLGSAALKYLGGVADLLLGIVTLDPDKIKAGFSAALGAYADQGRAFGEAFKKEYEANLTPAQIAEREAKRLQKEQAIALKKEEGHQAEMLKLKQAASAQNESEMKKAAEKLAAARKKAEEEELKALRALQDLKIAAIQDDIERQIATVNVKYDRELEGLIGSEAQKTEMKLLLEAERQRALDEIELERKEREREKQEEELESALSRIEEEEELKAAVLEEKYLSNLMAESQRDQALYDLEKAAIEAKLTLLREAGKEESLQYQKLQNEILTIEKEKNAKIIEDTAKREEAKRALSQMAYEGALQFVSMHKGLIQDETNERVAALDKRIEMLSQDEASREANAAQIKQLEEQKISVQREAARKTAQIERAQVIADGISEVAAIWKAAARLGLPVGPIVGALQTGFAVVRTGIALRNIDKQANSYYDGGFTQGLTVSGGGKLIDSTGHQVAGVVHANEWVGPQWMTESPKYAPVIRWLESERTRRFAEGGYSTSSNLAGPPPGVMGLEEMQSQLNGLRADLRLYASSVEGWARSLKVINDPRETRSALQTLNEIDLDSDL